MTISCETQRTDYKLTFRNMMAVVENGSYDSIINPTSEEFQIPFPPHGNTSNLITSFQGAIGWRSPLLVAHECAEHIK